MMKKVVLSGCSALIPNKTCEVVFYTSPFVPLSRSSVTAHPFNESERQYTPVIEGEVLQEEIEIDIYLDIKIEYNESVVYQRFMMDLPNSDKKIFDNLVTEQIPEGYVKLYMDQDPPRLILNKEPFILKFLSMRRPSGQ
jgi:hypothetical protein